MAPGIINETVAATKKFLEEHPEEVKKISTVVLTGKEIGITIITRFLGWDRGRVTRALADIKAIASGEIEKQALEMMPSQRAAEKLRKEFKSISKSTKVSPEVQIRAAKKIVRPWK